MSVKFKPPVEPAADGEHHELAAAANAEVANEASVVLAEAIADTAPIDRLLLKAAAGAGKSHVLKRLVTEVVKQPKCKRVAVIAFTNKQIHPLAIDLGDAIGKEEVCLFASAGSFGDLPDEVHRAATVATTTREIPETARVVIATSHKLGAIGELKRQLDHFGVAENGKTPFDVLFVDEAWQLPHHLFDKVKNAAPIWVGVGDVGQLPPL